MYPVVHFELPYADGKRIAGFYHDVFGWKTQDLGEESGHYILVTTTESDAKPGLPAGAINGGLYPVKPDWPAQYPSVVIGVDDINKVLSKIKSHGGKVLGEPMDIPGFGLYVSFLDTEGNRNSIIQPGGME
ncbi:MAG: VOC family protein [Bacteroidetes bacterium]|nr:VOC family protein [Bacteroidota bacterium]